MPTQPLSKNTWFEQTQRARIRLERWLLSRGVPPPPGWQLPQFLGIGAQKAGTTWLHRQLRCHPSLFLPVRKELHYFDKRYDQSLGVYARHFRGARNRMRGEITPAYGVLHPDRIQFIHRVMPDLKLILLLRNPVSRSWSHALMQLVKRAGRRYEDVPEEEFYAHFLSPGSRMRSDYVTTVDNWLAVYPADQLFVGFFEDVRERPGELLTKVFAHLNVPQVDDWSQFPMEREVHVGVRVPMPDKYREFLEGLYADDIERMIARFGTRCEAWRPSAPSPLTDAVAR